MPGNLQSFRAGVFESGFDAGDFDSAFPPHPAKPSAAKPRVMANPNANERVIGVQILSRSLYRIKQAQSVSPVTDGCVIQLGRRCECPRERRSIEAIGGNLEWNDLVS